MSNQVEQLEMKPAAKVSTLSSPVGKIIVVDDEPELRKILVEALSAQGFEVTGCSSGPQALAELRGKEFDLLLTDLMMPEMDGIALLEAALEIDPHLVGIMMTGQGTIQTAVDAMKLGAFDYVLKPFRIQTVMPVLTRAINTRRLRMENLQLRETVAIYGLCQTIAFTLDTQTVLSRLADAALQQSDADEVSILLPTSDGTELYVAAVRGEKRERLLGERIPLQESISSWVARERLPLILNGEVHDDRFVALWPRPEIRSAISVPMQVANKLLGIINLNVTNRLRPFTLGQMKALTILASTAAAALESASLYTQVQHAEEKYRSIFENAIEGVFQSTPEGRFITVNPSMARILGYESPDEVIATITDIAHQLYVHPESRAKASQIQEERGLLHGFEFEAYRKDGEKIWLSVNRRSVRADNGTEIYREGSIENITERKRVGERQARRAVHALFRADVSAALAMSRAPLRATLESCVTAMVQHLGAAFARVWTLNREEDVLELQASAGIYTHIDGPHSRVPVGSFKIGKIAQERVPHITNEVQTDPRVGDKEWARREGMVAFAGYPLLLENRMLGVMAMFSREELADDTLDALASVADLISQGIERKRAEDALRESEERYRDLVENAHDLIYEHDLEGNYTSTNKAGEQTTGYSLEESLKLNLKQTVAPEYLEKAEQMFSRKLAGEKVTAYELEILAKDGSRIPVEVNTRLVLKDGVPVGIQGIARDITKRKRAEEALRRQLDFTEAITASLGEGVYALDERGRVTFMNPASEAALQWNQAELLGKEMHEVIHFQCMDGTARPADECPLLGVLRSGHTIHVESDAFTRKDGTMFSVSYTSSPITTEGQVIGAVLAFHDISERKRAEEVLRESEESYRLLFESNPQPMWVYDLETLAFLAVNESAVHHYGYSREDFLAMTIKDIRPAEDITALYDSVARSSEGVDGAGIWRHLKKDGTIIEVEITSHLLEFDDRRAELILAHDITERKRAEEALRQSENQLSEAQRLAHIGSWNWDLQKNLMTWSDEHYRIFGVQRGDFNVNYDAGVFDFINPEDRGLVRSLVAKSIETKEPFNFYYRIVRHDGEERIIQSSGTIETDERGQPIRMFGTAQDVTERRRIEQKLTQSEERYRDLVENAHDLIYEHDLEGNYTSTNKAGEQITGYSLEESLKLNQKQIVAPAYLEKAEQMFRRKLAGKKVTAYDLEFVAKDGHHVAVEVNTRLVLKDGVPVGIQGIARDITKRKQAEEALRESEARKRAILESSMDCIITMDHEGLVVDWNPAAERTFGYTQEEAIGREMAVLIIPPRFREQHRRGLARYLATGRGRVIGQRLELSAERSDGSEFPIELTITRIESKGTPMFTGYLRDITERKKAENRLSAQYAVTRALAESNTIGDGASRILQAICESLGWEYGSLWTVDHVTNTLRCSQVWQAPGAKADEFESASRESVFTPGMGLPGRVWQDSQPVWIADVVEDTNFPRSAPAARAGLHGGCAFPIRFRSEILGVMEFFSRSIREPDPELLAMMVTIGSQIGQFIERKRVEEALGESEEQLRQSQKLDAIGQLAGGVAHDFNNLLTVIGGYSSILLGKLPKESPHLSSIEEIKKASDRASALTRQLLAFSRKQILQPKVLDLNIAVSDLEKMVRRLIGEDIDLLTITSPVLGKVKADPGQIEQVLLNLIVNARDAMPKGGKLTIETGNVVHSEEYAQRHAALPGPHVMLAVSDTGCGMDATIQPHVFEPFFTTKTSGKGTGLGLATVYGIVKQSGGNIWVYSEVERGSTFKVYLPRVDEVAEGEEVVISSSVPHGTEMVLLVEDEDQVRAILKHILEGQGYHVLSASNGEEAFSISQDLERDIKLMITDVVMPQMSGRELAERVLAVRPNLPVLFMSGYTDDAIVRHGLLDEKLNFMQKPFDLASVARKVREVLDSHL